MKRLKNFTRNEVTEIADRIERFGPEHDRYAPCMLDCVAVFRSGNITCYVPINPAADREPAELRVTAWEDPATCKPDYDLVIVLCEVTRPQTSEFPRACEMPVSSGDHAVGDSFVSIGFMPHEPELEGRDWSVAGFEMMQDCWTDARCFKVIGWKPLPDTALKAATT